MKKYILILLYLLASVFEIAGQHGTIAATTNNRASLGPATRVCGFGDSNMVLGDVFFLEALASDLGVDALQLGISGSLLTNLAGTPATSGIERYESQLIITPYTDYVVIQYGTNDIANSISAANYTIQLEEIVSALISIGYSPSRICLCSIPYWAGGAVSSTLDAYRTVILNIATTYGTRYFDLLQWMRDNGGNSLLTDTVHLNSTGQAGWKVGVYLAFTTP